MKHFLSCAAAAVVAACGTGGGGSGGGAEVTLELVAQDTTAGALVVGEGGAAIDVARLELQLRELKFLVDHTADDGDTDGKGKHKDGGPDDADDASLEDDGHFKIKGEHVFDLLDGARNTAVFELDAGLYKKIEFKVDKPGPGEGIDGGESCIWFEGTRDGVRFRYLDDKMDKITLRMVSALELGDGGSHVVRINLDVPTWLDGVDLAGLTAGPDGLALIEASGPNAAAHAAIEGNIKAAIKSARKP